jgi:glycosyltransferase involved in cell wall biosynthesis
MSATTRARPSGSAEAPLRLLHLIRSVNAVHGGPAEGVRQAVRSAQELGHFSEVLTLDAPGDDCVAKFPAATHAVGQARGNYGWTRQIDTWLHERTAAYDALVVHGLWQYHGVAARRAALAARRPYYVYPHGMLDPWFGRAHPLKHAKKQLYWLAAERAVLRDAHAVLFTTAEESRLALGSFRPYTARHEVLGYGLALDEDAQQASAEDFLDQHPGLRGRRLVLFLGRLHAKKGCDLLIDAFAAVAQHHPQLHLVMAGPDRNGLQAQLAQQAQARGVHSRITWTGMLEGRLKWGALRAAEVFVLPSHQENFGIAVAEALAVGTPVLISTQVNIWREIVACGAGLAEVDTLAGTRALLSRWLALPPATAVAMRTAALHCFDAHFRIDASVQRLHTLVAATRHSVAATTNSQPCNTARRQ